METSTSSYYSVSSDLVQKNIEVIENLIKNSNKNPIQVAINIINGIFAAPSSELNQDWKVFDLERDKPLSFTSLSFSDEKTNTIFNETISTFNNQLRKRKSGTAEEKESKKEKIDADFEIRLKKESDPNEIGLC